MEMSYYWFYKKEITPVYVEKYIKAKVRELKRRD